MADDCVRDAAPDMLAALEAIVFQVCQGKVLERDACIAQARRAMAKAGGRPVAGDEIVPALIAALRRYRDAEAHEGYYCMRERYGHCTTGRCLRDAGPGAEQGTCARWEAIAVLAKAEGWPDGR